MEKVATVSKRPTTSLPETILGYKDATANGDQYYIAARFDRDKEQVPRKFVLGDLWLLSECAIGADNKVQGVCESCN